MARVTKEARAVVSTQLVQYTPMSEKDFGIVFGKLAMQLRFTDADVATIKSYYEPLSDLPLEAVRMAQEAFSREAGRKWFPTSGEWRERAEEARKASLKAALSHRDEPWRVECEKCDDTGWILHLTCDGGETCGRMHKPLSLALGGKNGQVALEDAVLGLALATIHLLRR